MITETVIEWIQTLIHRTLIGYVVVIDRDERNESTIRTTIEVRVKR